VFRGSLQEQTLATSHLDFQGSFSTEQPRRVKRFGQRFQLEEEPVEIESGIQFA
jgi:hypothetical protein